MPDRLRTALVTGASRGIGRGIAERLAARGFGLTVAGRDPDRLAATAAALRRSGAAEVVTVAGDMADPTHPSQLAAAHAEAFEALSCLVLNAGVGTAGALGTLPMARFDKTVAVNLRAPFALLQQALPMLRAAAEADPGRGARVFALASITGVYAEAGLAAYGATKAAVVSLVETLNAEESAVGVMGTAVAPGYVETEMTEWIRDRVPATEMIPVDDVVHLVDAVVGLTARTVVPRLVLTRAGASPYSA